MCKTEMAITPETKSISATLLLKDLGEPFLIFVATLCNSTAGDFGGGRRMFYNRIAVNGSEYNIFVFAVPN